MDAAQAPRKTPVHRRRLPLLAAAAAVLLLGTAGGAWALDHFTSPCAGEPIRIKVAAEPSIVPALRDVVERYNVQSHTVEDRCVRVELSATDSASMVSRLSSGGPPSDVWVPESSVRLQQATKAGAKQIFYGSQQLAITPLAIAATAPVAAELRAASVEPAWRLLADGRAAGRDYARRVLDPASSIIGTFTMVALDQKAFTGRGAAGRRADFVTAMRRTAPKSPGPLFGELTGLPRGQRLLIATTEQAVVAYNASNQANPAQAMVPAEGSYLIDYPYAVLTSEVPQRQATDSFLAALRSRYARDVLQRAGFRRPDGTFGPTVARRLGLTARAPQVLEPPSAKQVDRANDAWQEAKE